MLEMPSVEELSSEVVSIAYTTKKTANVHGRVSLVGAGPGDPDLLTLKALREIQQADLIVYDRLVSKEICSLFPSSTPLIYVGKAKGRHCFRQEEINAILIAKARLGMNICRLKGGDVFVFGRGGEEMLALCCAGIDVELVPGVTAAAGCTAYAGIPLTHRGLSQGCTFVTAHTEKEANISWQALAQLNHTLVFYMGLTRAGMISQSLIAAGLSANTPVALIEKGCCSQQRVVTGELWQLEFLATQQKVKSPALIVVGLVVTLAAQLQWFTATESQ